MYKITREELEMFWGLLLLHEERIKRAKGCGVLEDNGAKQFEKKLIKIKNNLERLI